MIAVENEPLRISPLVAVSGCDAEEVGETSNGLLVLGRRHHAGLRKNINLFNVVQTR